MYENYDTDAAADALLDIRDIMAVKMNGIGAEGELARFKNTWDRAMAGQKTRSPDLLRMVQPLLLEELKKCSRLQHDVAHYERLSEGPPDRSLEFLYGCLERKVEQDTKESNRKHLADLNTRATPAAAATEEAAPKQKANGKLWPNPCYRFSKYGECWRGDQCWYRHVEPRNLGRGKIAYGDKACKSAKALGEEVAAEQEATQAPTPSSKGGAKAKGKGKSEKKGNAKGGD